MTASRRTALFWVLFSLAFFLNQGLRINDMGLGNDTKEYLAEAYHIAHGQGFSTVHDPDTAEPLDAYRPPGYAAFLSLFILADPGLRHDRFEWYFDTPVDFEDIHAPAGIVAVKWVQAGLLFLAALLAMSLTRKLTDSKACGYAALVLVSLHPFPTSYAHRLYAEGLAIPLIALFAWLLHRCLANRQWRDFILAGLVLGALILTKGEWYYIGPFCLAWIGFTAALRPGQRARLMAGALVIALCAALFVVPWKMRNLHRFGRAMLSERSGVVLDLRSRYAVMSPRQSLAAFVYWSGVAGRDELLESLFEPGDYQALEREKGIYRAVLDHSAELEATHPRIEADRIQFREAAGRILSHPWSYVRTLPVMAWRGMIDGHISVANLVFYLLFAVGAWSLARRKDWENLGALMPFVGQFLFNSLVTHNLPRLNGSGTVLLMVGSAVGACAWIAARRRRKAQMDQRGANNSL